MIGRLFGVGQDNDIPYRLRALDVTTGKELWKREFSENGPLPFADPLGDRVVLGWYAKSPGAESAAKRIPQVWEIFKHAKISKLDSYFEVLDALSGKSVGGVLIQVGSGPASYDAAFSAGDALFLIKDGKRVSVYSLQDGNLKVRLTGGIPTANSRNNLFAMEEGPGRLVIYDPTTAAKLDEQIFPDAIAYAHFSVDGNRLLVLTRHQVAYVLDVSGVHANSSATPAPALQ
jgi:PQQ enzyme repeat